MPKEKDEVERLHDTIFRAMQQQPLTEEEADRLIELRPGSERSASAEEPRKESVDEESEG